MAKQNNKVSVDEIVQDMCNLKDDFQQYMTISEKKGIIQDAIIKTQSELIDLCNKQLKELYISCIILAVIAVTSLLIIVALV